MITFNSRFNVSKSLSPMSFLCSLTDWFTDYISADVDINCDLDQSDVGDYSVKSDDGLVELNVCWAPGVFGAKVVTIPVTGVQHIATYVLTTNDDVDNVLSIFVEEMRSDNSIQVSSGLDPRDFIRMLFWDNCGGMDDGWLVSNKALMIDKSMLDLVQHLFEDRSNTLLPFVYIVPNDVSGFFALNYSSLASDLAGQAHVLVEDNPMVSRYFKKHIDKDFYPDFGNIVILFPDGTCKSVESVVNDSRRRSAIELSNVIKNAVHGYLNSRVVPENQTFLGVQGLVLRSRFSENPEVKALCDMILQEKDDIISSKTAEIDRLNDLIANLTSRVDSYEAAFARQKEQGYEIQSVVPFCCGRSDLFYDGEIRDIVIKVLQKEVAMMDSDSKCRDSRKFAVLSDLISHNPLTGGEEVYKEVFREAIGSGDFSQENIRKIEKLGFVVSKGGNNHWRVAFKNDMKYSMVVASTPSDYRSGANSVSNYMNKLFGY